MPFPIFTIPKTWAGVGPVLVPRSSREEPEFWPDPTPLAVLAYPNMLEGLFYYTKGLVSVELFPPTAGERIELFAYFLNGPESGKLLVIPLFLFLIDCSRNVSSDSKKVMMDTSINMGMYAGCMGLLSRYAVALRFSSTGLPMLYY